MTTARRIGSASSKTRITILESAERLILDDGYAAVSYRKVAARAGVTVGLVHYYFPDIDELFIALLRRRSEANLQRLVTALEDRADEPLRVIWEFNTEETSAALMMEFLALANHRKSIKSEIADVTLKSRKVQLAALAHRWPQYDVLGEVMSPAVLLFLSATLPKMVQLEESVGIVDAHGEVLRIAESLLNQIEPR